MEQRISKLELERYIQAYKEGDEKWFNNKEYLRTYNDFEMLSVIDECVMVDATQEQIEQVLIALGVDVV